MSPHTLDALDFRWLFDSAPDAMVMVDAGGTIVLANPQAMQLFGYEPGELIGQSVEVLVPQPLRPVHRHHREGYNQNPRTRPMGSGLALSGLRKDGSEFPLEISLSALRTAEGLLALAAIRDISGRRRTEDELERHRNHLEELVAQRTAALEAANARLEAEVAERRRIEARQARLLAEVAAANEELQNFAYVVSHDLKAPLRAIESLTSWIAEDYADRIDADGKEQMALLIGRVHRMNALIDGILQYSRLGRIREKKVLVDLNHALREAVDLLSPPPNVSVTVREGLPSLEAEHTRMVQVFQNLIGNAIRHNDKSEPRIEVHCRELPDAWQISVADNGPGIDPKHFERIFQMFQTLAPRDRVESTGIGLTLVKRIIEAAGGRIWVESAPGAGAVFHFTLPRAETAESGEAHGTRA